MWQNLRSDFKKFDTVRAVRIFIFFTLLGCSNSFSSFSNQESDEALLYTAREYIRDGNFTKAIEACTAIGTSNFSDERYAVTCASAYAGRCGYDTLSFVNLIQTVNPPAATLFGLLLSSLNPTVAQDVTDCVTAEGLIHGLGDASERSTEANGFVVLFGFYKVGVMLNELADDADENGAPDGGFDACVDIVDADANEIATSFVQINESLTVLSSQSTLWSDLSTAMTAMCTVVEGVFNATYNICAYTSGAFTANQRNGVRTMVMEGAALGIDQCTGDASAATCNCP